LRQKRARIVIGMACFKGVAKDRLRPMLGYALRNTNSSVLERPIKRLIAYAKRLINTLNACCV
jgi:hypothetical protein